MLVQAKHVPAWKTLLVEDSSIDPINVAKVRGADFKEPDKAAIARKRKIQRNKAAGKKDGS